MLEKLKLKLKKQLNVVVLFLLGAYASNIFPPFDGNIVAFGCLLLFLSYLLYEKRNFMANFMIAYWFGIAFFLCGFSWITNAFLIDGETFGAYIPLVSVVIGLFFGLFVAIPAGFIKFGENVYQRAIIFCLAFSVFEWIRSFIFTGFPWNLLGSALAFDVRLISGAAYIGTYGLSIMLLMFLSGLAILLIGLKQKKLYRLSGVFLFIPLMFFGVSFGTYKEIKDGDFMVRLVQPSIPQTFKWDKKLAQENFEKYINLSKKEGVEKARLIVWGEAASPFYLDRDEEHLLDIMEIIPDNGLLVTGLLRAGIERGDIVIYNSMFAIDNKIGIRDYYDKSHLVPFGEYLPFREYLPDFMRPIANVVGDIGKGEKYKTMRLEGFPNMAGSICYESIFPSEVIAKGNKPEILLVLANDGWYGISDGPYQHLVASQLRAIEEGITVVRSANTGISAVVKPNGDIVGRIGLNEVGISDVYLPEVLVKDTIYGKYGNWVVGMIWMVMVVFLLFGGRAKVRS